MSKNSKFFLSKSFYIIFIVVITGMILIYIGSNGETKVETNSIDMTATDNYRMELERVSASMCAKIQGVDTAEVCITFDGGMSCVYAKNSEGSMGGTYFTSGGDPLFLKFEYPQIVGCVVICSGTVGSQTKLEITEMMSAYLGIPANKIFVGYKV